MNLFVRIESKNQYERLLKLILIEKRKLLNEENLNWVGNKNKNKYKSIKLSFKKLTIARIKRQNIQKKKRTAVQNKSFINKIKVNM